MVRAGDRAQKHVLASVYGCSTNNWMLQAWLLGNRFNPIFNFSAKQARIRQKGKSHGRHVPIFQFRTIEVTVWKSAAEAACQYWVVHRPASGVACPLKGGSAMTRAGWEFTV